MISSLQTLALEALVESPEDSLAYSKQPSSIHRGLSRLLKRKQNKHLRLRDDVFIPANQCENILKIILKVHGSSFLHLFHDNSKCVLKMLDLANADLTDQSLLVGLLENHHLEKVVLSNAVLKAKTARKLAALSNSLKVLDLSGTSSSWKKDGAQFLKSLNNLTTLDVSFPTTGEQEECLKTISQLPCLEYLDLSGWSIRDLTPITKLSGSLKKLSLYDVCILPAVQSQLSGIFSQMTSLVHLDISQNLRNYRPQRAFEGVNMFFARPDALRLDSFLLSDDDATQFRYLNHDVITAIASLPKLVYLDISGCRDLKTVEELKAFGLDRLEFLGIFETGLDTVDKAIPVKTITGIANEEQIIVAMQVYVKREASVLMCLYCLLEMLVTTSDFSSYNKLLQVVVAASRAHLKCEEFQHLAMCFFSCCQDKISICPKELHRSIVSTILDVMDMHSLFRILKLCCNGLISCGVPQGVEFEAKRVCEMMLQCLEAFADRQDATPCSIFKALVSSRLGRAAFVNHSGAIRILLNIIKKNCEASLMNRLMVECWNTLWNISDEIPENGECFIENGGLEIFADCMQKFENEPLLHRAIMGLMGNIAEVDHLRSRLMNHKYVELFIDMLDLEKFDFEVGYQAAGVLSHMTSDGERAWKLTRIGRHQCMEKMIDTVSRWDVQRSRSIYYRSLKPILRLISKEDAPAAQFWTVWVLANLTGVYPEKYCELLVGENALNILRNLLASLNASEDMKRLAQMALDKITTYLGISSGL
eukprot:gene15753-17342_t